MLIETILRIGQIALCVSGKFDGAIRTGNTVSIAEQEVDLLGSVLNAHRFPGSKSRRQEFERGVCAGVIDAIDFAQRGLPMATDDAMAASCRT